MAITIPGKLFLTLLSRHLHVLDPRNLTSDNKVQDFTVATASCLRDCSTDRQNVTFYFYTEVIVLTD